MNNEEYHLAYAKLKGYNDCEFSHIDYSGYYTRLVIKDKNGNLVKINVNYEELFRKIVLKESIEK